MMNYEIFKEVVKEKILDYMPPEYGKATVEILHTNKVNKVKDGLTIRVPDSNVAPTVYLNDLFDEYEKTGDLQSIMVKTATLLDEASIKKPDFNTSLEAENVRDKIVFQLMLEPGGINHSESSRNNQSELIRNSQCTCLADRLPTVIQRDR